MPTTNKKNNDSNWDKTLALMIDYVQSDDPPDANILIKKLYGNDFFLEGNTHHSKIVLDILEYFL